MSRQPSSSSLFFVVSVLVMLFCLHGSNAQLPTCYNSTIAPPQCLGDGMISFPQVFLTAEAQGATPESTYAQAYGFFNGLTAAPAECQKVGVEFLCGAFYGNCADFSVVCRDTCELFLQTCGPVFQSFGVELQGLPPCDMFMEDNCNTLDYQGTYPIKECPGELVSGDGGNCAPKCPTPYFSDEEQDAIDLLLGIGSFFSFFGALFIIITHILRWKEEKDTLVIWVAVSFCLMALNIMWGFLYGWQDMRCKDDITVNEYEPAGVVFGLGFIWIGLYCTIWWFNVCLNMAITLIFKKTTDKYRFKIMHIFTWIFPIIIAIISLAVEKVGCVFGLAICLYQADERDAGFQAPTLWYSFGLFWFPITLFFFAGVVLLIFVIIWIMRTSGWSGLVNQWRLLAFIIAIFLTYFFPLVTVYDAIANSEKYTDDIMEWTICLLMSPDPNSCDLTGGPAYGLHLVAFTSIGFCGFTIFLIFGLSPANLRWWQDRAINVKEGESFFKNRTQTYATGTGSKIEISEEEEMEEAVASDSDNEGSSSSDSS